MADMDTADYTPTKVITVWILIDADGRAVADCNREHLQDEYEADYLRPLEAPTQLFRVPIVVPLPRAVELARVELRAAG